MTEAELSRRLYAEIYSNGADSVFGVNAQAGERGGDPEFQTSQRKVRREEPVTIDISCTCLGYFADMTRTVSIGKGDSHFESLYRDVLEAQEKAIEESRVGATAGRWTWRPGTKPPEVQESCEAFQHKDPPRARHRGPRATISSAK